MCTYYPIVLLFYLVWCTFHFVLLKRHLKVAFYSILLLVHILFIRILSIRILFSFAYFFSFVYFSFVYFLIFVYVVFSFAYVFSFVYFSFVYLFSFVHLFSFVYFSFVYFSFVLASFLRSSHRKCSIKFHNIHRKTTLLESLFNKVAGFKRNYNTPVFLEVLHSFQEFSSCKRLVVVRILLHFIYAIYGVVTKLSETYSLFLVKSKYRLTFTQGFFYNCNLLYSFKV